MSRRTGPPEPSDRDAGVWAGRSVARRFVSPDGFVVLVGRTAADNDVLTFKIGAPRDFWLHVAADSGSHVVVRNPDGVASLPRDTVQFAAGLAAGYSKLRGRRPRRRPPVHLRRRGQAAGHAAGQSHHRSLQDSAREADHHGGLVFLCEPLW
jgi:hypothetical protein